MTITDSDLIHAGEPETADAGANADSQQFCDALRDFAAEIEKLQSNIYNFSTYQGSLWDDNIALTGLVA